MRDEKNILEYIHSEELLEFVELSKNNHSWCRFKEGYEAPTREEMVVTFAPLHAYCIADLLGYSGRNAVIVNIRPGGPGKISYAKWRLFLILSGRVSAHPGQSVDLSHVPSRYESLIERLDNPRDENALKPAYKRFNEGYAAPTHDQMIEAIEDRNLNYVADIMGLSLRTVERYLAGSLNIQYAAWRLFLIETDQVKP